MPANRLARLFSRCDALPAALAAWAKTRIFGTAVKFFGTAGIRIDEASVGCVRMTLRNRRDVQNHIGGVHAAGMALLAESASGLVLGLNLPDNKLPLLREMRVRYVKRAKGDLRACAQLSEAQIASIKNDERGDLSVPVQVFDSSGESPIEVEMIWAWRLKQSV